MTEKKKEYLRVGVIVRPHGVHGAVKLDPLTDDVARFAAVRDAFIENKGIYTPVVVSDVGVREDAVYAGLSCCATREDAEKLRGAFICVDRAHTVKLPENSHFVTDLIGCEVIDENGKSYGKLRDVLETGANDVYVISGERKLMLPALTRVFRSIDTDEGRIVLDSAVLEEVGLFED